MKREPITYKEARERIGRFLHGLGLEPKSLRGVGSDHVAIEFSHGLWADEVTLYLKERPSSFTQNKDAVVRYDVELSWSTTGRSVSRAAAAVANY